MRREARGWAERSERDMRMLVIDGDRDVRETVADLVVDHGIVVSGSGDTDEARRILELEAFDVVLCHLPFLHADRGRLQRCLAERRPRPRVVAMSGAGLLASSVEADVNLAKPFKRAQLLAVLMSR